MDNDGMTVTVELLKDRINNMLIITDLLSSPAYNAWVAFLHELGSQQTPPVLVDRTERSSGAIRSLRVCDELLDRGVSPDTINAGAMLAFGDYWRDSPYSGPY